MIGNVELKAVCTKPQLDILIANNGKTLKYKNDVWIIDAQSWQDLSAGEGYTAKISSAQNAFAEDASVEAKRLVRELNWVPIL